MDSESELDEFISQAIDQKVENLDSVIEQKAGETAQAMLSSAAFKDAIDGMLRQYGLISKNAQPVIDDGGITIDISGRDGGEGEATGVFGLEFDLDHVRIEQMTRRIDANKTNDESNIIVLDPVPERLDLAAPGGSDLYDITFRPDEGYTIDYFKSNDWYGSEIKDLKAHIKDLIDNKGWPESSYSMTFGLPIRLSWTKQAFPDLDTIHIVVKAVPIEDPAEDLAEG
jgi:hypothetical protein